MAEPHFAHSSDCDLFEELIAIGDYHIGFRSHSTIASITARAMGAAVLPPVASDPELPPFSTTTATATCGSSAGANPVNQACGEPSEECSAAPVLPATSIPLICAAVPVPESTTPTIMSVNSFAVSALTARASGSGDVRERTVRSLERIVSTRYGVMGMPSFAMAAEIIATCRGVTRTSYWPIAVCAVCGSSTSSGYVEGETLKGMLRADPKPNSSAW